MNKFLLLPFLCLFFLQVSGGNWQTYGQNRSLLLNAKDTVVKDLAKEDALIREVVVSRTLPQKEKVQYFNQVTRYGFKNLFSNYSYNPSLPYTAQINPNAEIFIQDYMRSHGSYLQEMKGWGQPYFNLIENVLQQYGLPRELKYIAVIESNLSTGATSNAGAGGPWQFMRYTARDYGLTVNAVVDDRRDYFKSTHAAAKYLLSLYRQMHDWLLVMAAYNGGPGKVYDAIKKSGSRNFWDLQYYLPEESRTYVKRFIATHYIMEGTGGITTSANSSFPFANEYMRTSYATSNNNLNPFTAKTNLPDSELTDIEALSISGKYNSLVIAKNLVMDITIFNHFNPGFDAMMASNGNYDLRLTPDKMQLFVANKYVILNECVQLLLSGTTIPENKTVYATSRLKKKH